MSHEPGYGTAPKGLSMSVGICRISTAAAMVALALSAVAAGCRGDEQGAAVVRRDSAGVRIVESREPVWHEGEAWAVADSPALDLTKSGQGHAHEFFNVLDADRLSDGSIVVAEAGGSEIRLFSPKGAHVRTLGREGDGPGEFRWLGQVAVLPGDSLWAYDFGQGRVTVFDPDGVVARTATLDAGSAPRPVFPLASGTLVASAFDHTGFREKLGLHRMPSPIVRMNADGGIVDTLTTIPGWESVVHSRGDAWAVWAKKAHLAVHGDEVYLGSADEMEYQVRSSDGRLQRLVRVPGYDLTLSPAEIEAENATYMPDPSAASSRVREIMDRQPMRTRRPAYSAMIVDTEGYVWLKLYQGHHERPEPTEWLLFDTTGRWLGSIGLPPQFDVFRIGPDWILGKREDELEVEHVQLLSLSRDG